MIWAVFTLCPFLCGLALRLRTDHGALRWLPSFSEVSDWLARWGFCLAEYEYDRQYRPGIKHELADEILRMCTNDADSLPLNDTVPCFAVKDIDNAPPDK